MRPPDRPHRSLMPWLVAAALVLVMVFALDEYWGLAERLFGGAERTFGRHTEFALEGGATVIFASLCAAWYRRLTVRERQLSGLLTVCAWCRRVSVDGRWVTIETFLKSHDGARTSVSLCPSCFSGRRTHGVPPHSA